MPSLANVWRADRCDPIYLGKVRQGSELFEGEHQAIIEETLWGDVQRMLDDNKKYKRSAKNKASNARLSGLLYDDAGNRMVASHARKKDTIYRYYTSVPLMRGSKNQVGSISRVSAPRIESKIIEGLRSANIVPPGTSDAKLLKAATKIIPHAAEIELHLVDAHGSDRLIRIAADMRSAKNSIRIIDAHGANQRSQPLIKALALAHIWRQEMERGVFLTLRALANAKGLSESYVWKVLRLGYLAPDIVEAILDGRQPSGLSLNQINATKLSRDWGSQRSALGFPQIN